VRLDQRDFFTRMVEWGWWFRAADIVAGCSLFLLGVAAMLLTAPEGRTPDRLRRRRIVLRAAAGVAVAVMTVEILQGVEAIALGWWPPWILILPVAGVAAASWWYLQALARRLPSPTLTRYTRDAALALVAGCALMLYKDHHSGYPVVQYMRLHPLDGPAFPWTLACLAYLASAIGLLVGLWVRFRSAARQADRNWVSDP
jgi:hypothetical protein